MGKFPCRRSTVLAVALSVLVAAGLGYGASQAFFNQQKLDDVGSKRLALLSLSNLEPPALRKLTLSDVKDKGLTSLGLQDLKDERLKTIHLNQLRDQYLKRIPLSLVREKALGELTVADLQGASFMNAPAPPPQPLVVPPALVAAAPSAPKVTSDPFAQRPQVLRDPRSTVAPKPRPVAAKPVVARKPSVARKPVVARRPAPKRYIATRTYPQPRRYIAVERDLAFAPPVAPDYKVKKSKSFTRVIKRGGQKLKSLLRGLLDD